MNYLPFIFLIISCSRASETGDTEDGKYSTLQDSIISSEHSEKILEEETSYSLITFVSFYKSNEREFNSVKSKKSTFPILNTDSIAKITNAENKVFEIKTNEKTLIFKNVNPMVDDRYYDEDIVQYYNVGYNKDLNKHLVYASYYEYGQYFLIDGSTANVDTLNGFPYFSPNLEKLMCYFVNPYKETEINGQFPDFVSEQEFYVNSGTHFEIAEKKSFDYIPVEIKWANDSTLFIKGVSSYNYDQLMDDSIQDGLRFNEFVYRRVEVNINNSIVE